MPRLCVRSSTSVCSLVASYHPLHTMCRSLPSLLIGPMYIRCSQLPAFLYKVSGARRLNSLMKADRSQYVILQLKKESCCGISLTFSLEKKSSCASIVFLSPVFSLLSLLSPSFITSSLLSQKRLFETFLYLTRLFIQRTKKLTIQLFLNKVVNSHFQNRSLSRKCFPLPLIRFYCRNLTLFLLIQGIGYLRGAFLTGPTLDPRSRQGLEEVSSNSFLLPDIQFRLL